MKSKTVAALRKRAARTGSLAEAMLTSFFPDQGFEQDSWGAWRTMFKALEGEPLEARELRFFTKVTGRTVAPTSPVDEAWLIAGRGAGKSSAGAVLAGWTVYALAQWAKTRLSQRVLPRGQCVIPIIAASQEQATAIFSILEDLVAATPALRDLLDTQEYRDPTTSRVMRFRYGIQVKVIAAGYAAVRSIVGCPLAIIDEGAFIAPESDANRSDLETYRAVRPALKKFLVETRGANCPIRPQLVVLTSPFVQQGQVWKTYEKFHPEGGKIDVDRANRAKTLVMRASTTLLNPMFTDEDVLEAIEADEAAKAEYLAEFRGITDGFISSERLGRIIDRSRALVLPPRSDVRYFAFVDLSSMAGRDSTAVAVAHADPETATIVLDATLERRPGEETSYELAMRDICALLKAYGVEEVVGDGWGKGAVEADFRAQKIKFVQTTLTKSEVYNAFLTLLPAEGQAPKVELPADERLQWQFLSLKRKVSPTGHETIDSLRDMPEDLANVVAGVCTLVKGEAGQRRGPYWSAIIRKEYGRIVSADFRDLRDPRAVQLEREADHDQDPRRVPAHLLHPHVADGPLYGHQRVVDDHARTVRHLRACTWPSCPDVAHLREDVKAELHRQDQRRLARERRER